MLFYYLLFFFITVGAKLLLALVMIFILLPGDRRCGDCEGETLLVEGHPLVRWVGWIVPGRLERRWCPNCGHEGFARTRRRHRGYREGHGRATPEHVHDVDHR